VTVDEPTASPEQRVGMALRQARQAAGVSLRQMAKGLHYGSHSVLFEYEYGARMPAENVVAGYERMLALPTGTLMAVWERANIERHGDAWPKRRNHVDYQGEYLRSARTGPNPLTRTGITPDTAFSPQQVADGADPDAAGCSHDAITLHSRRIALRSTQVVIGHVELRYNSRMWAVWGRFEGYASLNHLAERNHTTIRIEVVRGSDQARQCTDEPYCFDLMWGNLLVADRSAFYVRATVLVDGDDVGSGCTNTFSLPPP
jgi:hypothetical protein